MKTNSTLTNRILKGIFKGLNEALSYNALNEDCTTPRYSSGIYEMSDDDCKELIDKIVKSRLEDGEVISNTYIFVGPGTVDFNWSTDLNGCVHIDDYKCYWRGIGKYSVNVDLDKLNAMLDREFPNPLLKGRIVDISDKLR